MTADTNEKRREDLRQRRMAFWSHLEELRKRLLRAVIGLIIAAGASLLITPQVMRLLLSPMGELRPVALHPTESFVVYFRVGMLLGLMFAMPYILFQLLAFIVPALTRGERRALYSGIVGISLFFALGVAFAAFVLVPLAVGYLKGFMDDLVQPTYSVSEYISFVTTLMLSCGIVFETPLALALAARLGFVTARQLAKGRRWALLAIAAVSAAITPTPDAFNMLLVMAPLLVLYEVGIGMAWLAERKRRRTLALAGV